MNFMIDNSPLTDSELRFVRVVLHSRHSRVPQIDRILRREVRSESKRQFLYNPQVQT